MNTKRVIIGLSGGVDSSVAAYLLKDQGFEVIGMTMIQYEEPAFLEDARKVASHLGIEHCIVHAEDIFKETIMEDFCREYEKGRTPNPCTLCNPLVKWKTLLTTADSKDAFWVATGHYARIDQVDGRYTVRNSETAAKDQTYALCNLRQDQLERTLMPIGIYTKEQVREIARRAAIPVAEKQDSQDICFIPDKDYARFLEKYTNQKSKPGEYVNRNKEVLGQHEGVSHYTIGQRKGLNLAMGHPVFVTGIDAEKNQVIIGEEEDLFQTVFYCDRVNYMSGTKSQLPRTLKAKIRYAHHGEECQVEELADGTWRCCFRNAVRAITAGQTAVFYDGEYVFAGARIQKAVEK